MPVPRHGAKRAGRKRRQPDRYRRYRCSDGDRPGAGLRDGGDLSGAVGFHRARNGKRGRQPAARTGARRCSSHSNPCLNHPEGSDFVMIDDSSVNSQIVDAVSSIVTLTTGQAPAQALGMLDAVMLETLGMAMHNAVNRQQGAGMINAAAITAACAKMISAPFPVPPPPPPAPPGPPPTVAPLPGPPAVPPPPAALIAAAAAEAEAKVAVDVLKTQAQGASADAATATADLMEVHALSVPPPLPATAPASGAGLDHAATSDAPAPAAAAATSPAAAATGTPPVAAASAPAAPAAPASASSSAPAPAPPAQS
ncbi:Translation initiation factor IF-2 (modular protein) [Xanthomonas citri pv. citri]|uniref:Translation initiation factor IF-2 (Modular protein) n=2 Tax=Xanthomonas citri TaxID=346 RepID=A0A0U5FKN2_XANCI|nr:Translation initiation factor IF-2 (modular protein) [Xanthomonas citri pv. citri]CEF20558.1 Translation initiation factor IF-2 (modular protein) [Xanthomonas citri pv. citri]CEG17503.1 Translation initiation factor IF-2 (modular protein) [Xanthomonas citri pv. citri]CEH47737.1 Translation initiation factor IF-2 (modular protein) [Xanthomonas citri pv. citri]CEH73943.1 Translation initiation factor IF-2 (modular protein) [Xanthomonas citri pv. citri]